MTRQRDYRAKQLAKQDPRCGTDQGRPRHPIPYLPWAAATRKPDSRCGERQTTRTSSPLPHWQLQPARWTRDAAHPTSQDLYPVPYQVGSRQRGLAIRPAKANVITRAFQSLFAQQKGLNYLQKDIYHHRHNSASLNSISTPPRRKRTPRHEHRGWKRTPSAAEADAASRGRGHGHTWGGSGHPAEMHNH